MSTHKPIQSWIEESLNAFINEISLTKSRLTVESYTYDLVRFFEYLSDKSIRRIGSLKSSHIIGYLNYCREGGKSENSVKRYYMAIRAFSRFLHKSKKISTELTNDIPKPRIKSKAPYIPTTQEIDHLLGMPDTSTEAGTRDKAMLELLYSSGLRASELCNLQIEDLQEASIIIRNGKRDKTRTIPITDKAKQAIGEYIARYRGNQEGYLFLTTFLRQMRRQVLCGIITNYARKAGIRKITTHTLRHACATHLLNQGADLRLIQEVLGHSSIASTQRYTHLTSSHMQQMFNQFHPRRV